MTNFKFTEDNLTKLKEEFTHYPSKKPVVMKALWLAQEQNGYISQEVIKEIADLLEMNPVDVLGVVTFYTMYQQKQMGKFHIQVCTNVSCMLRGGYEIFKLVKEKLGIDNLDVTEDGKFSIEEVECMGACGGAPMIAVNEDYYENFTQEKVTEILDSLKQSN